jgi:hypothetical protein
MAISASTVSSSQQLLFRAPANSLPRPPDHTKKPDSPPPSKVD